MASFLPDQPADAQPIDSFFWKAWFRSIWTTIKKMADIALVQTADFYIDDCLVYPVDTTGGPINVYLPPAADIRGRSVLVKQVLGANGVIIWPVATETIDGSAISVLVKQGDAKEFVSNGVDKWYIKTNGASLGPLTSPLTTKGDLWGYDTTDNRIPVGANGKVLTADSTAAVGVSWQTLSPGGADTNIQFNDGGAFGGESDFTWDKTNNILTINSGGLTFSGTGNRILGDFSNGTFANRTWIQNSVANASTAVGIMPSGTGVLAQILFFGSSNLAAATQGTKVGVDSSVPASFLDASIHSGGTQQPLELRINNSAALNIDTTKNAQFKAGIQFPVVSKTSNYPIVETDSVVLADCTTGNVTLTLPAANIAGAGFTPQYIIKRIDSSANTVTISRAGADTLDGGTTYVLGALQAATLVSDGVSAWYVV